MKQNLRNYLTKIKHYRQMSLWTLILRGNLMDMSEPDKQGGTGTIQER